ncbi:MAG: HDIG domain-containing protein [Patescibacteria group bacterium]|jgi:putative nucleotidyltransferase with HDIG domain|nr:HDIG domain-containing protein [Patescibacteria group bacterium]
MNRQEALQFLQQNLTNQNLIKHSLAVEAVMFDLAKYFNENSDSWALAGLLHDIDYEQTKDNPAQHSLIGAEMLDEQGIDPEIIQAVKTHNEMHGIEPQSLMAKALYCSDPITGLIVASALVLPDKKIGNLNTSSVIKRFNEPRFAAGANRQIIGKCKELLDLDLEKFVDISLKAMQKINQDLGL